MFWKMLHGTYLTGILAAVLYRCVLSSKNVDLLEGKQLPDFAAITYKVIVLTSASSSSCEKEFLSVTIDTNAVKKSWRGFNFSSTKLQNAGKALSPVDLRFGGSMADFLTFDPTATTNSKHLQEEQDTDITYTSGNEMRQQEEQDFTMSGQQWDELTTFVQKLGWNLIFDFNIFRRNNGVWDLSNADLLLNYSSARGVQIRSFQLGNEPNLYQNSFNVTITPSDLVADFRLLKSLISNYALYKNSSLYGPDVTKLNWRSSSTTYLRLFIEAGGTDLVDEIAFHHYYLSGALAKVQDFLNATVLDSFKTVLDVGFNLTRALPHHVRIRLTETSSCTGGGALNMTNAYVAGFLWLDKLGIAAQYGVSRVFRQTFVGSSYELVSSTSFNPNPDFYLSVLFKRLVEGPVFPVSSAPPLEQLRVYANCARRDFYPVGALVLYFLNLSSEDAILSLDQYSNDDKEVFLLTPGDEYGLNSRFVKLNGQILLMSGNDVPEMLPSYQRGDITVGAQSFGFIVIPQAYVPACVSF